MNRRTTLLLVAGTALALAVAAAAYLVMASRGASRLVRLAPDDAGVVAQGGAIYRANCAACHGSRLEGQPNWRERRPDGLMPAPPHDATGHTWHHADDLLFRLTKEGVAKAAGMPDYRSAMPVYDGVLTDAQIVAVLSWIKAQWPPEIRARQEEIDRRYRESRR